MADSKRDILGAVNMLILIAGGIGAWTLINDKLNEVSTKEFHHEDSDKRADDFLTTIKGELEPIAKSANAAESNTLPPRIANLLKIRCANPSDFTVSLQDLLARSRSRYEELNNRQYTIGTCVDGVYYNSLGVRVD